MFDIFKKKRLTSLADFDTNYEMSIKNQTIVPQEKEPLELSSRIAVSLSQRVENNRILSTISSDIIDTEVSIPQFEPLVNTAVIVSDVLKQITVERSLSGEFKNITNKKQILRYWDKWRKEKVDHYFPILEDQEKFVEMMNESLPKIDTSIKNEFQYLILLPECYHFKDYVSSVDRTYTSIYSYTSKFLACPELDYRLKPVKIEETDETITITLKSVWMNEIYIKEYLKHTPPDVSFNLAIRYCLDKKSGQVVNAKLKSEEIVNQSLKNVVNISLE